MYKLLELQFNKNNQDEKLVLYTTTESLETTGLLSRVKIYYEHKEVCYLLYSHFFQDLEEFKDQLESCLNVKARKNKSIVKNIGYYHNQHIQKHDRKNLVYTTVNDSSIWVGNFCLLFYSPEQFAPASWLYNENSDIVFELTPVYPWFYQDPKEGDNFEKYSDWMKEYYPVLKVSILKSVAREWLQKLNELFDLITKVSKSLKCDGMLECLGCIKARRVDA